MDRREAAMFLLASSIAPRAVFAQSSSRRARVAILLTASMESSAHTLAAARERLRELGHVEGNTLFLDVRSATGDAGRLASLAKEMVAAKPDAIIVGSTMGLVALRQATSTIPIVMAGGDVAGMGQVKNLARPEGNITGVSALQLELRSKLFELALAINPRGAPLAVLGNPAGPLFSRILKGLQSDAAKLGVELLVLKAQTVADIDQAFAQLVRERARTVVVSSDAFFIQQRQQIAEQALRGKIATVFARREHVEAGGLMSYGSDLSEGYRMAASYVDRILKGAKPADLPVQQPTKFELAVNLKTAKAIGVTVPRDVMLRADVTIQ